MDRLPVPSLFPWLLTEPSALARMLRLVDKGPIMLRLFACSLSALMLGALAPTLANASPSCLRDQQTYKLAGDPFSGQ